ncbi:hypothetical protein ACJMK2_005316, partial [Sinanodonta woodiana]
MWTSLKLVILILDIPDITPEHDGVDIGLFSGLCRGSYQGQQVLERSRKFGAGNKCWPCPS